MAVVVVNNPFMVGKHLSDKYFCDRASETEFLRKQVNNGRNVALISPRRLGKSDIITAIDEGYRVYDYFSPIGWQRSIKLLTVALHF